ncbi:MAG: FAD binding domain-containing protein, partial [Phenylobacterium sp.]
PRMQAFDYRRPTTLGEALALLETDPEAMPLAGGMTLIPTLKQRLAAPSLLVDLSAIQALKAITEEGGSIRLGAMVTHGEVARSPVVRKAIPALAELAGGIGDPHVRNRGTAGGSVANADPAADYPAAVVGLGATVVTSRREIAGDDFFTGLFETALQPAELVTAVHFPIPDAAAYVKFPNPASRYAMVGVFVARFGAEVRAAVTGAAPSVFRLIVTEAALEQRFSPDVIGEEVEAAMDALNADGHAPADYRAHLIAVMARRAVAACLARG